MQQSQDDDEHVQIVYEDAALRTAPVAVRRRRNIRCVALNTNRPTVDTRYKHEQSSYRKTSCRRQQRRRHQAGGRRCRKSWRHSCGRRSSSSSSSSSSRRRPSRATDRGTQARGSMPACRTAKQVALRSRCQNSARTPASCGPTQASCSRPRRSLRPTAGRRCPWRT